MGPSAQEKQLREITIKYASRIRDVAHAKISASGGIMVYNKRVVTTASYLMQFVHPNDEMFKLEKRAINMIR
eukprot:3501120-Karenia_brevis.AAC.1